MYSVSLSKLNRLRSFLHDQSNFVNRISTAYNLWMCCGFLSSPITSTLLDNDTWFLIYQYVLVVMVQCPSEMNPGSYLLLRRKTEPCTRLVWFMADSRCWPIPHGHQRHNTAGRVSVRRPWTCQPRRASCPACWRERHWNEVAGVARRCCRWPPYPDDGRARLSRQCLEYLRQRCQFRHGDFPIMFAACTTYPRERERERERENKVEDVDCWMDNGNWIGQHVHG